MRPLLKRIHEGEPTSSAIFGYSYHSGKGINPYKSAIIRDLTYMKISFSPTRNVQFEFLFYREYNFRNIK